MEYFYQIKLATDRYDTFNRPVLVQNIVEKENKQEVLRYIESEYPEYFEGNKVAQKLSKKSEQIVYVTIFELDEYWKSYWTQTIKCAVCGREVPLLSINQNLGYVQLNRFTCSPECELAYPEHSAMVRDQQNEDYWNSRCNYYYIYKITHKVTGKCYIGYTEREPIFRWWEHLKHSELPIGQALKTEGIEMFTFEVIEKHSKDSKTKQEMHAIETKHILAHDSIDNGYNCVVSSAVKHEQNKLF